MGSVIDLIDRQNDAILDQLVDSIESIMPPEIRIKKINGEGLVSFAFTNNMLFSDDIQTTLNSKEND